MHIVGEDGEDLPQGESGTIYFEGGASFEYHNDPEKTKGSRHPKGWSTLGDVGYLDDDGFLYLTDRKAYMIISGGVNIYPQEAENVLVTHPKVVDVAVFGVPNDDFGEEVKAVVQPVEMPADDAAAQALASELIAFCRSQLADVKCPRSIDFREELPRHPTGKLYKRLLKDEYWAGRRPEHLSAGCTRISIWDGPIPFAHRGGTSDYPENTMPAFEHAVALGYRYLETDVHLTADGVLVAFHDTTCCARAVTGRDPRHDLGRDLRRCASTVVQPIPLMRDLLERWPDVRFNIDCKADSGRRGAGPPDRGDRADRPGVHRFVQPSTTAAAPPAARSGPADGAQPAGGRVAAPRRAAPRIERARRAGPDRSRAFRGDRLGRDGRRPPARDRDPVVRAARASAGRAGPRVDDRRRGGDEPAARPRRRRHHDRPARGATQRLRVAGPLARLRSVG